MGVLPSAPETGFPAGFSPESTPTLGLHQSRVRRRLCHLGSKIKINGNGNGDEPISLTGRHQALTALAANRIGLSLLKQLLQHLLQPYIPYIKAPVQGLFAACVIQINDVNIC